MILNLNTLVVEKNKRFRKFIQDKGEIKWHLLKDIM